ncbi:hypothetical protein QR680_003402 [Steinernema hermaphroditum]|uniref:Uncharacterized protein n=1 Tax=Steinernema hermaphroditum TaxID=289476 RepID=A0AA39LK98_9BILA|nr:hypothetical protein QR680_003402 [Steinernema hermaphroditum]
MLSRREHRHSRDPDCIALQSLKCRHSHSSIRHSAGVDHVCDDIELEKKEKWKKRERIGAPRTKTQQQRWQLKRKGRPILRAQPESSTTSCEQ